MIAESQSINPIDQTPINITTCNRDKKSVYFASRDVEKFLDDFLCVMCQELPSDPVTIQCGEPNHLLCRDCAHKCIDSQPENTAPKCPTCDAIGILKTYTGHALFFLKDQPVICLWCHDKNETHTDPSFSDLKLHLRSIHGIYYFGDIPQDKHSHLADIVKQQIHDLGANHNKYTVGPYKWKDYLDQLQELTPSNLTDCRDVYEIATLLQQNGIPAPEISEALLQGVNDYTEIKQYRAEFDLWLKETQIEKPDVSDTDTEASNQYHKNNRITIEPILKTDCLLNTQYSNDISYILMYFNVCVKNEGATSDFKSYIALSIYKMYINQDRAHVFKRDLLGYCISCGHLWEFESILFQIPDPIRYASPILIRKARMTDIDKNTGLYINMTPDERKTHDNRLAKFIILTS